MNTALHDIIKKLVSEQGMEILNDSKRVNAYLSDLATKEPKPQRMAFVKCLMYGFHGELQNTQPDERAWCKNRLAQKLNDEEGLDITITKDTLDLLEAVLFGTAGGTPEPGIPVVPGGDSDTIHKQGNLVAFVKTSIPSFLRITPYEKGTLTLYGDRLEWRGKNNFDLSISKIESISFVRVNLNESLEIKDGENNKYNFYGFDVKLNVPILDQYEILAKIVTKNNRAELESWRQAIEKQRRLLY